MELKIIGTLVRDGWTVTFGTSVRSATYCIKNNNLSTHASVQNFTPYISICRIWVECASLPGKRKVFIVVKYRRNIVAIYYST